MSSNIICLYGLTFAEAHSSTIPYISYPQTVSKNIENSSFEDVTIEKGNVLWFRNSNLTNIK